MTEMSCKWFLYQMSERCPFILKCRACSLSPTYCNSHFLQDIRYTIFRFTHVICVLILYCRPVLILLKLLQVVVLAQHLQRLLLQVVLPVLVGGGEVSTLARTSMSFRLRGREECSIKDATYLHVLK